MNENTVMTYKVTPDNLENNQDPTLPAEIPNNREAENLQRLMQQVLQILNRLKFIDQSPNKKYTWSTYHLKVGRLLLICA